MLAVKLLAKIKQSFRILTKISEKKFLTLIFASNLILRLFRLDSPNYAFFDEKGYYLKAVHAILAGQSDPNYPHPPFAKELIGLGIKIFGDNPWGWRSLQAVLSSLAVVVVYFIARRLFGSRKVASLTAFLMTIEVSWFVLSRVAIPEMFMISFFTLSLFFFIKVYQERDNLSLILGSSFFGLALACKWAVLIFLPIILILFLRIKLPPWEKIKVFFIATSIVCISYLLPFLVLTNHNKLADIVSFNEKSLHYHLFDEKRLVQVKDSFSTNALFWPIEFYFLDGSKVQSGLVRSVVLFYNPVVLWISLGVSVFIIKKFLAERKINLKTFLVGSFLIFWLVWFISPRDTYPYYWAIAMPFAAMLTSDFLIQKSKKYRWEVGGLLLAAVLIFLLYYPLTTNWPVRTWYLSLLTGIGFK